MANVWKIGSRWSDNGDPNSSILHIFRRNGYVFVGSQEFGDNVRKGDYIAIADGYRVVAVAKVLDDNPTALRELITSHKLRFRESDIERFDFRHPEEWSEEYGYYGTRVHIVDLLPDETFLYKKMSRFHAANLYWNEIKRLYDNSASKRFDITSKTFRLKNIPGISDQDGFGKEELLAQGASYNIPVYQREYSWGEDQINRFIRDIFANYWGVIPNHNSIVREPMFIGTMQLSQKRRISDFEYEQDIIDGQQRISTILCFLKYLQLAFPESKLLRDMAFDWLHTNVNNYKEDIYLQELCNVLQLEDLSGRAHNVYIHNCHIIQQAFEQAVTDDSGIRYEFFDIDDFCAFLYSSIYFVAVETAAGLSKTIKIFNTINTAGLDLNGDDIFKVRLYEYLHDKQGESEDVFNQIGERYERIKVINEEWNRAGNDWTLVNLWTVRDVYKDYIISRFDLANHYNLYPMATDTFFEKLFDILLDVQSHDEFGKDVKEKVVLNLEDLDKIIDAVAKWNQSSYETREELIAYDLMSKSFYGRYWRICPLMVLLGFDIHSELYKVLLPLAKIYFCHSVYNSKRIYEIDNFTYSILKILGRFAIVAIDERSRLMDELLETLEKKLAAAKTWNGYDLTLHFVKTLPDNKKRWWNLLCSLSAWIEENEDETPIDELEAKLSRTVFNGHDYNYDFEHIRACNDPNVTEDDPDQNTIGNLVLLEYYINRSIQDIPFEQKKNRPGALNYKDSGFVSVKRLLTYENWGPEEIRFRREQTYRKILAFLWGEDFSKEHSIVF